MADAPMQPELMKFVDILLFAPDEFGLHEVCAHVKYDLGVADDQEVKRLTLEVVHELLRRGALVEFDSEAAAKQRPEMTADEIVCAHRPGMGGHRRDADPSRRNLPLLVDA